MGIVSTVFYVGMTLLSGNILADSIGAVGLMIAFYYGMTGFACVWYYRRDLGNGGRDLLMKGLLPLTGGLILLAAFLKAAYDYSKPDYGNTTFFGIGGVFVVGIGALLLGALLMLVFSRIDPPFFQGRTLVPGRPDLLLSPDGVVATVGLPDSGRMPTVISPDLSNLPPGRDPSVPPDPRNPPD